jgi:predicted nucleic acid-binding protein
MAHLRERSYDAKHGETVEWWFDEDKLVQKRIADLRPMVAALKEESKSFTSFTKGLMHKQYSIPNILVAKLAKEHNLDVFTDDANELKRMDRIIQQEYPHLIAHSKKVWRPT